MSADAWAVLALVMAGGAAALWFRLAYQVQLPENRGGFVVAWLAAAGLGIAALWSGTSGAVGTIPAVLAILVGLFLTFTFMVSRQVASAEGLELNAPLVSFQAVDEHGAVFDSKQLEGKPVLIKFFRGHW